MFKKILISNRGEIACRVIKTAQRMGIATVAVYSDADRSAKHVAEADEAVHIGGSTAAESYLNSEKIIQACQQTEADAVHPGYGFLSENPPFSARLVQSGICFIGPGTEAITAMGDKITSKLLAENAGVNTIPGHADIVKDSIEAVGIANRIGYPVMIKATAGGGGKGMRIAYDESQCHEGFERATSEAVSSFGDGRVFIEKFIEQPRHIEIQLIADHHGNVVTLNERECSIQRRHQKIIEEAPSPFLDEPTRKAMSEQATALAKAVGYHSVGTVEFIVDAKKRFYFLEMNTRLQVEHPVTEYITGLDLVELMIRVANGESLPVRQEDIKINGWSVESRIYAESPFRNFLPSTGRLVRYQAPMESDRVRVDDGVYEGAEISMFYDPMIAKLVTWGETRESAIDEMQKALAQYYIRGVETNLPFLAAIMGHARFQAGALSTDFIAQEFPDGFHPYSRPESGLEEMICVIASIHDRLSRRAATTSGQLPGYGRNIGSDWVIIFNHEQHATRVLTEKSGWTVRYEGKEYRVQDRWQATEHRYRGSVDDRPVYLQIEKAGHRYGMTHQGQYFKIEVFTPRTAQLQGYMPIKKESDLSAFLLSPMPGLLVSLTVKPGQKVKAGEEVAVIEAMKMENSLRAEHDALVANILVEEGSTLEVDQPIMEFESL